jgi:hypothetical protein
MGSLPLWQNSLCAEVLGDQVGICTHQGVQGIIGNETAQMKLLHLK